jgi:hypothetical protein
MEHDEHKNFVNKNEALQHNTLKAQKMTFLPSLQTLNYF